MGSRDDNGEPVGLPWEFYRWHIAEQFGWTLGQVDALSMGDISEWMQIEDAKNKRAEAVSRENAARHKRR